MAQPSTESLRRQLEEIDAKSAALHAELAELASQRGGVVQKLKAVTCPQFATLPAEITTQIFSHYHHDNYVKVLSRKLPIPFILAAVCGSWRQVALQMPQLWTRLMFAPFGYADPKNVERKFRDCVAYAGENAGLDIVFHGPASIVRVQTIFEKAEQWAELAIGEGMFRQSSGNWNFVHGRLTRLRSLTIWAESSGWGGRESNFDHVPPITVFETAPLLEHVALLDIDAEMFSLPWTQLKTLELLSLRSFDTETILPILCQLVQLETLNLRLPIEAPPPDSAPVRLERLVSLTIDWVLYANTAARYEPMGTMGAVQILRLFELPILEELTTELFDYPTVTALGELLTRSGCTSSMRRLALTADHGQIDPDAILTVIPRLDKLRIVGLEWRQLISTIHRLAKDTAPQIRDLQLETVPGRIPYAQIASLLAAKTTSQNINLVIPPFEEGYDGLSTSPQADRAAMDKLRSVVLSPNGPNINIQGMSPAIAAQLEQIAPPLYTLGVDTADSDSNTHDGDGKTCK
ncbi:hypothetical protein MIND_00416300 [Mycena indigotica]|uniref:F-box domain-containing protein n=1 Tax=Mycena indigotica TaxID=2126181 RepID=A0A8H6SW71_9AGAR|nr:uncharacterized protein MIND_00416300 [Mycena indigotica]KAF7306255.1 hypothetical protein MIND_00416300 [Mycena indigotica]